MKRLTSVLMLLLLLISPGQSARIITNADIARWYLDADMVLICSANRIDTIFVGHHDSVSSDNICERYDLVKEKYHISVDSIIKGNIGDEAIPDTIKTPDFLINYSKIQTTGRTFSGFNSKGDSIFQFTVNTFGDEAYFDFSYFRLELQKQHLVILRKADTGYVINYESEVNENILKLIDEVKSKGESYFSTPSTKKS